MNKFVILIGLVVVGVIIGMNVPDGAADAAASGDITVLTDPCETDDLNTGAAEMQDGFVNASITDGKLVVHKHDSDTGVQITAPNGAVHRDLSNDAGDDPFTMIDPPRYTFSEDVSYGNYTIAAVSSGNKPDEWNVHERHRVTLRCGTEPTAKRVYENCEEDPNVDCVRIGS